MSLFTPNTDIFNNYYDKARYLLAWRISLLFSVVFLILLSVFSITNFNALLPGGLAFAVSFGSLLYLLITKNFAPLFWVYTISGTLIVHFSINTIHELSHFVDFIWITAIILLAFIGFGKKIGLVFVFIQLIGISYFLFFNLNHHINALHQKYIGEIIGAFIEITLALFAISYLLFQYIEFNSYSEEKLRTINNELNNKNNENIVLVKEVHHRVKNNLQIITSLLRLQKSDLTEESQKKFDEAINRVMAMSIIHKKLYQTEELSRIDVESYIKELINEIVESIATSTHIKTNIDSKIETIGLKTIVPFGLLINELLSNSIKHAFTDKHNGVIDITISSTNNNDLLLIYKDNGCWKEPDNNSTQFGLELINVLTDQLEGNFNRNCSEYTFNLKNLDI